MAGFTKLFNSILDSTIWQEPNATRLLWITMLAMCDARGEVQASIPGLARRAGITIPECESGLSTLLSPDRFSRSKENEGRRISEIDGGWELLNHGKYRALLSAEERREYNRKKQAQHRAKKREAVNDVSMTVNHNKQCQHIADSRVQKQMTEDVSPSSKHPPLPPEGDGARGEKNLPTTPQALRIAKLYRRRETTAWSDKEVKAFKKLGKISMEDLEAVCRYEESEMAKGDDGRHRRDLLTFLNNFPGEQDRATASASKPIPADPSDSVDTGHRTGTVVKLSDLVKTREQNNQPKES